MVRQDKGIAASDLKCSEFAYRPAETPTSPTATSNAAAFTLFSFLPELCYNFQNFPAQNFVGKLA